MKTIKIKNQRVIPITFDNETPLALDLKGNLLNGYGRGDRLEEFKNSDCGELELELSAEQLDQIAAKVAAGAPIQKLLDASNKAREAAQDARDALDDAIAEHDDMQCPYNTQANGYEVQIQYDEDAGGLISSIGCKSVSPALVAKVHKLSLALRKRGKK